MKVKSKRFLSLLTAAAIIVTSIPSIFANEVNSKEIEGISATYTKGEEYVGNFINADNVDITLNYKDGTSESVGSNCEIKGQNGTPQVTEAGNNDFTVTYAKNDKEYSTTLSVWGYKETGISAEYVGPDVLVGTQFYSKDVNVKLNYTPHQDGTEHSETLATDQYTIVNANEEPNPTVTATQWNDYKIKVETAHANSYTHGIKVWGYQFDKVTAQYNGPAILVGKNYNMADVVVSEVYTPYSDNTVKTDNISSFNVNSTTVTAAGNNKFTATTQKGNADFNVEGYEITVTGLIAKYNGPEILVGGKYSKEDIEAIVTYSNGTQAVVTEFTVNSTTVSKAGENTYTVKYGNMEAPITVWGYEKSHIRVEYNGEDILVGETFFAKDVDVFLVYTSHKDGTSREEQLAPDQYTIKNSEGAVSSIVKELEWNEFSVTYNGMTENFQVWGYAPKSIKAVYNGNNIFVGDAFSKSNVSVRLMYTPNSNGVSQEKNLFIDDCTITDGNDENSLQVSKAGINTYTVVYRNVTTTFDVWGYKLDRIEANYVGSDIRINESYDKNKVHVDAFYTTRTDNGRKSFVVGTDEFTVNSLTVSAIGENTFTATYKELTDDFIITGFDDKVTISSIIAQYNGPDILVDNNYDIKDITINVTYSNGETGTIVEGFTVDSTTVTEAGKNTYTVNFNDSTTTVDVWGYKPSYIEAEYVGPDILVENQFASKDVNVKLIYTPYSDGAVKEVELEKDQFTLTTKDNEANPTVKAVEWNTFVVNYEGMKADINVWGYKPVNIVAKYNGNNILVGTTYKSSDVEVALAYTPYSDGTIRNDKIETNKCKITNALEQTSTKVLTAKENTYTVKYNDLTTTFDVWGYKVDRIEAEYVGGDILVGKDYKKTDVNVIAYYTIRTDGGDVSTNVSANNFTVNSTVVNEAGENVYTVTHAEETSNITVWGYKPSYIEAEYVGPDILVGNQFASKDVKINLVYTPYSDNTIKTTEIKNNFTLTTKDNEADPTVKAVEWNTFVVNYEGMKDEINVWGYKPSYIDAVYTGNNIFVGESFKASDVTVNLVYTPYSDNTVKSDKLKLEDCTITNGLGQSSSKVLTTKENTYTVKYNELVDSFDVWGYEIDKIAAEYKGKDIRINESYVKDDVEVTVFYTERTDNGDISYIALSDDFTVDSLLVTKEGKNNYTASLAGKTDGYTVNGFDDNVYVASIKAQYIGPDILVGNTFKSSDVKVTVKYTDGTTKDIYQGFSITPFTTNVGPVVETVKWNTYTVTYSDMTDNIEVWGYKFDKLEAKYTGNDIYVGNNYDKKDVKVTATFTPYSNGKVGTVDVKDFDVNSLAVKEVGENKYDASCEYGKAPFTVKGLKAKDEKTNNIIKLTAVDKNDKAVNNVELKYSTNGYTGTLLTGKTDTATLGIGTILTLTDCTVGVPNGYKLSDVKIVTEKSDTYTTYIVKVIVEQKADSDDNKTDDNKTDDKKPDETVNNTPDNTPDNTSKDEVRTGDESNTMLYVILGGSSLLAMIYLVLAKKKENEVDE